MLCPVWILKHRRQPPLKNEVQNNYIGIYGNCRTSLENYQTFKYERKFTDFYKRWEVIQYKKDLKKPTTPIPPYDSSLKKPSQYICTSGFLTAYSDRAFAALLRCRPPVPGVGQELHPAAVSYCREILWAENPVRL